MDGADLAAAPQRLSAALSAPLWEGSAVLEVAIHEACKHPFPLKTGNVRENQIL